MDKHYFLMSSIFESIKKAAYREKHADMTAVAKQSKPMYLNDIKNYIQLKIELVVFGQYAI